MKHLYDEKLLNMEPPKLIDRLTEAEEALKHCILSTGGYTGGKPQQHLEKYGISYKDYWFKEEST